MTKYSRKNVVRFFMVFYLYCNQEFGITKTAVDIIEICDVYFIIKIVIFPENDQYYLDVTSYNGRVVLLHFFH